MKYWFGLLFNIEKITSSPIKMEPALPDSFLLILFLKISLTAFPFLWIFEYVNYETTFCEYIMAENYTSM